MDKKTEVKKERKKNDHGKKKKAENERKGVCVRGRKEEVNKGRNWKK